MTDVNTMNDMDEEKSKAINDALANGQNDDLLRMADVADYFGIGYNTIWSKCKNNAIPGAVKVKGVWHVPIRWIKSYFDIVQYEEPDLKFLDESTIMTVCQSMPYLVDSEELPGYISTGFAKIDDAIGGGLPEGLTILGGGTSVGKTTLCLQIAANIAMSGYPVLYISIEQNDVELCAKLTACMAATRYGKCISASDMLSRTARAKWDESENALFAQACDLVNKYLGKTFFIAMPHASESWSADDVCSAINGVCNACHDRPPFVVIDYLQLLMPRDDIHDAKLVVDSNLRVLRQISRDYSVHMLLVSSLNRMGYAKEVNMESFKESGGIEYAADVLLGLQPADIARKVDPAQALRAHKSQSIRECELIVLKNRNGAIPREPVQLTFDAIACKFEAHDPIVVHRC